MPDQEQEESVDAFMDSKESFYTDLDFAIDGSDDSFVRRNDPCLSTLRMIQSQRYDLVIDPTGTIL
jgi:hypothetical protein